MITTNAKPYKHTAKDKVRFTVLRPAFINGTHFAAGEMVMLTALDAKYHLMNGTVEEQS